MFKNNNIEIAKLLFANKIIMLLKIKFITLGQWKC